MNKKNQMLLLAAILISFILSCSEKDGNMPSSDIALIKSFDFNIVSGNTCTDGGFVLVVSKDYNTAPSALKMSVEGKIEWEVKLDSISHSGMRPLNLQAACQASDGYVLAGTSSYKGKNFLYLRKLNNDGSFGWETFIEDMNLFNLKLKGLANLDIVICGSNAINKSGPPEADGNLYTIALSKNGRIKWIYPISENVINKPVAIAEGPSSFFLCLRNSHVNTNAEIIKVLEWDSSGKMQHYETDSLPKNIYTATATNMIFSPDNKLIVSGYGDTSVTSLYKFDFWMQKIYFKNKNLLEESFNHTGNNKQNICSGSMVTNNGSFVFFGGTNYEAAPPSPLPDKVSSMYLVKTDVNCKTIYTKNYGEKLGIMGVLINQNKDNSFSMLGTKQAYGNQLLLHTILIRTQPDGNF
jgi:hypothetical protein